jgi:NAD(P)H-hydrate epimerase
LNSDTGIAPGAVINAAATVTFIGRKQGLYTGQGPDCCGDIAFDDLGVSARVYDAVAAQSQLVVSGVRHLPMLGPRRRSSHKGEHGHLLLIAGGSGMAGAAMIAGRSALRTGSRLVSVVTHPDNLAAVVSAQPEMMVHAADLDTDLALLLERADVVAIGPGLGKESWAKHLWESISNYNGPLVVDADGLNLLAANADQRGARQRDNWVLTPHVGEAARLLGCDREQIEQDRFGAVAAIQKQYGGVALLKGAGTLIADGQDVLVVVRGGNPGMASGGMGDALTGAVGAFIAQGLAIKQAAVLGAAAHAWAADLAANEVGERGLLATDLISCLPAIINGNFDSVQAENFDPDYESTQAVFSG